RVTHPHRRQQPAVSSTSASGNACLGHRFVWRREPQPPKPPRMRVSGTVSFGFESLSHQNHRDRESQPPFRLASSASATGNESLSHRNHRDREPQAPFRLASRASATKTTEVKSILIFLPVPFNFP